jgi:Domain of unknown function (DUF4157)
LGILSRRRPKPAAERADAPPGPSGSAFDKPTSAQAGVARSGGDGAPSDRQVIRAEDLAGPGWTRIPPPPPLLRGMPFVVARDFERELVSWRSPELSLAPLSHAVSEGGPSGVIEARAVGRPEAADGRSGSDPTVRASTGADHPGLSLGHTLGQGHASTALLPSDSGGPTVAPGGPEASRPSDLPLVRGLSESGSVGEPALQSLTFGSGPAATAGPRSRPDDEPGDGGGGRAGRPSARPSALASMTLLRASTPPGLPIVQLPVIATSGSPSPSPGPNPGRQTHVTVAAPGSRSSAPPPPAPASETEPGGSSPSGSDLVGPPPNRATTSVSDLVARPPNLATTPVPDGAEPGGAPKESPANAPPSPPRRAGSVQAGARRAGLGEPIGGLPPTAASFDVKSLITTAKGRARILSLAQPGRPGPQSQPPTSGHSVPPSAAPAGRSPSPAVHAGSSWAAMPVVPAAAISDLTAPVFLERLPSALGEPDFSGLPDFARPAPPGQIPAIGPTLDLSIGAPGSATPPALEDPPAHLDVPSRAARPPSARPPAPASGPDRGPDDRGRTGHAQDAPPSGPYPVVRPPDQPGSLGEGYPPATHPTVGDRPASIQVQPGDIDTSSPPVRPSPPAAPAAASPASRSPVAAKPGGYQDGDAERLTSPTAASAPAPAGPLPPVPAARPSAVTSSSQWVEAPTSAPLASEDPLTLSLVRAAQAAYGPEPAAGTPPGEGAMVRTMIGQRHGIDLSGVPVERGLEAATRAQRISARAFTSHSGVVIPRAAGSLDSGPGAALLAHELTHIAQRARLGQAMPPEHSPAGRRLEAEALSAELALAPPRGVPVAPGRAGMGQPDGGIFSSYGSELQPGTITPMDSFALTQSQAPAPDGHGSPASAAAFPVAAIPASKGVDRAEVEALVRQMTGRLMPAETTAAPAPSFGPASVSAPIGPPAVTPAAAVQRAANPPPPPPPPPAAPPPSPPKGPRSLWPSRPSDTDLAKMARWLYPLISFKLRGELREGRERSGMVTDTYGRW